MKRRIGERLKVRVREKSKDDKWSTTVKELEIVEITVRIYAYGEEYTYTGIDVDNKLFLRAFRDKDIIE